ncbi:C40 family peptidase [Streptantibioticus silvisoli]|uniref:C40 family peptidase n=1 Tax=Streptantibioticus silvisoli TaxID=2705255 RepID=A0ABT6W7B0_9ACTN|nr:C40 family peptidase [Streptantibioticus silvisoli]MDI5965867.1 C40 family peptidase [Streptantibioticus silvisoli]
MSATGFTETGQAAARPTPEQVRQRVDKLYQQAEAATQKYDGAQAKADRMRGRLGVLQDQLARRTQQTNASRDQLGWLAAERYRTGGEDPTLQLLLTAGPGQYLERAEMLARANAAEAASVRKLSAQEAVQREARDRAAQQLSAINATEKQLDADKKAVDGRLGEAERLLGLVGARQRAAIVAADPGAPAPDAASPASAAYPPLAPPPSGAPSARAAAAVAFAYAQLGKPYAWGATGPSAYDCSGLTQAAWAAAGVTLPRTTYSQINAGSRVDRSQLRPGDLVFYYAGVSHVAIYVGHGQIIHAPHPGAEVRLAPVNEMPFVGASRPA